MLARAEFGRRGLDCDMVEAVRSARGDVEGHAVLVAKPAHALVHQLESKHVLTLPLGHRHAYVDIRAGARRERPR